MYVLQNDICERNNTLLDALRCPATCFRQFVQRRGRQFLSVFHSVLCLLIITIQYNIYNTWIRIIYNKPKVKINKIIFLRQIIFICARSLEVYNKLILELTSFASLTGGSLSFNRSPFIIYNIP